MQIKFIHCSVESLPDEKINPRTAEKPVMAKTSSKLLAAITNVGIPENKKFGNKTYFVNFI